MKHKRTNIGSISHATLLNEHLLPRFADELLAQKPCRRVHRSLACKIRRRVDKCLRGRFSHNDEYFVSENAQWDLDALMDALNEYAPAYFYFGTHSGDGSDFGYWLPECFPEDFDGLKVSDTSEVPRGYSGEVLFVNDHGNMTLYAYSRGRGREVWAIV
jgi:hypothetical protein